MPNARRRPASSAAYDLPASAAGWFSVDDRTASISVVDQTAAVLRCRRNVLISEGTGSGRATRLNALLSLLPAEGRVISNEDGLELR